MKPRVFTSTNPDLAARDGKWKFLVNYDDSDPQLYDLMADPAETKNLATQFPEVASRLRQAIQDWNATMPADAGDPAYTPVSANTGELSPQPRQRLQTTQ
jgi:hypothetical protein